MLGLNRLLAATCCCTFSSGTIDTSIATIARTAAATVTAFPTRLDDNVGFATFAFKEIGDLEVTRKNKERYEIR